MRWTRGPGLARFLLLALLVPGPVSPARGQNPYEAGKKAMEEARAAYRRRDYAAYAQGMREAVRLRPDQPTYLYFLAGAEALTRHPGEALRWLGRVASMGMIYEVAENADFASLAEDPGLAPILERFEKNKMPVGRGAPVVRIDQRGLLPEGIAFDARSGTFFVGSVHQRKILAVDGRTGAVRDFSEAADGLWGVFGMKVDPSRNALWVCTSALPEMEGFRKEDEGKAGLFRYDLAGGKLGGKFFPDPGGGKHLFGDLTVSARGDVYVSDSTSPDLFLLRRGRGRLEPYLAGGPFVSLQGLSLDDRGKVLYVADYSQGIFALDLKSRRPLLLPAPPGTTLLGLDGLYRHGSDLIAVQNGTSPNRVVRIRLSSDRSRVEALEVVEANTPDLTAPTLGVVEGDDFYLIANGEWDAFDEQTGIPDPTRFQPPVLLKIPL